MFKDLNGRKFMTFLRFSIAALTIVAATEAFARGEGGGGAGEGGAGELAPPVSTQPGLPQLDTPPNLTIDTRSRATPSVIQNNCKLEWRQLRYC